ncbi:MAG: TetR/AcrR family transcriptional regulator [Burkholderiales bacterium]
MARPRAPTFETQRAGIHTAAARLFAENGFASASMAQIARACGVSKPLLYHYYRDKAHLLFDIADTYIDRLIAITAEVRARRLGPEEELRAMVGQFMREYEHSQAQHVVLVQDVKFLGDEARGTIVAKQRAVVDAFARTIAAMKPRWTRRALRVPLAMILFGMINWTFTWLRTAGPLTYDDMARVVTDIFLHGVLGAAAAEATQ